MGLGKSEICNKAFYFFDEACTTEFGKYVDAQDIIVTNTLEILP